MNIVGNQKAMSSIFGSYSTISIRHGCRANHPEWISVIDKNSFISQKKKKIHLTIDSKTEIEVTYFVGIPLNFTYSIIYQNTTLSPRATRVLSTAPYRNECQQTNWRDRCGRLTQRSPSRESFSALLQTGPNVPTSVCPYSHPLLTSLIALVRWQLPKQNECFRIRTNYHHVQH
jgi:hypothetical protein